MTAALESLESRKYADATSILASDRRSFLSLAGFIIAVHRLHCVWPEKELYKYDATRRISESLWQPPVFRKSGFSGDPIASVLGVNAVFAALNCAIDALDSKAKTKPDLGVALAALTEMLVTLWTLMKQGVRNHCCLQTNMFWPICFLGAANASD